MKNISVIFMGTPEFCTPILEYLINDYNVIAVVTQPDKEVGRKKTIEFSPIKKKALEHNIKVLQPEKIMAKVLSRWTDLQLLQDIDICGIIRKRRRFCQKERSIMHSAHFIQV